MYLRILYEKIFSHYSCEFCEYIAAGLQKVAIIKNTESSFMSNCTKELYTINNIYIFLYNFL